MATNETVEPDVTPPASDEHLSVISDTSQANSEGHDETAEDALDLVDEPDEDNASSVSLTTPKSLSRRVKFKENIITSYHEPPNPLKKGTVSYLLEQ